MAELTYTLGEHPQIIELLSVLEKNNLQRQKEEVQALVGYIDGMEDKLAQMMEEMKEIRLEVGKLHDKGIRAKCAQLVTAAEGKIQQVKAMVSTAKANLISSAGRMVQTFRPASCGAGFAYSRRSLAHGTRLLSCRQGDGAMRREAGCIPGGAASGGNPHEKRRARPCRQRSTAGPGAGGRQRRACQAAGPVSVLRQDLFRDGARRGPAG